MSPKSGVPPQLTDAAVTLTGPVTFKHLGCGSLTLAEHTSMMSEKSALTLMPVPWQHVAALTYARQNGCCCRGQGGGGRGEGDGTAGEGDGTAGEGEGTGMATHSPTV